MMSLTLRADGLLQDLLRCLLYCVLRAQLSLLVTYQSLLLSLHNLLLQYNLILRIS